MQLPFPEAERWQPPKSLSRHQLHRMITRTVAQRWANRLITLFSYYSVGTSCAVSSVPDICSSPLTPLQAEYARGLVVELIPWCRLPPEPPPCGGRGSRISDVAKRILATGYGLAHDNLEKVCASALPVVPSRVALPKKAGLFRPETVLEEPYLSEYKSQWWRNSPPHQWGPLPKACNKISRENEVGFAAKLIEIGMAEVLPERLLRRRTPDGKCIVPSGGWFCVPHKAD